MDITCLYSFITKEIGKKKRSEPIYEENHSRSIFAGHVGSFRSGKAEGPVQPRRP